MSVAATDPDRLRAAFEDDRLALEAVAGRREAAEALVRRYMGRVYGLTRRMLYGSADAEDAAQEAMLRAIRFLSQYRPEGTFDRWLLKIASNTCLDYLRKRRPVAAEVLADVHAAPEPDPQEELNRDRLARIEQLLPQLSDPQRAAFVLFHYEDRSLREIAEILDMPEGTVRSTLHRARRKLRDLILLAEEGCCR